MRIGTNFEVPQYEKQEVPFRMRNHFIYLARSRLEGIRAVRAPQASLFLGHRDLHISTRSSSTIDVLTSEPIPTSSATTPDARFEVIGGPYSLLSVSLSASQNFYTRRGTLIGVGGNAENTISTLSILEPFRRAVLAIPFLYQKISSTSPVTALISTNSSLAVVKLDGSMDWKVFGKALLAWTGQTLSITPTRAFNMSLAHWGNSEVTGRGLIALAGQGSIYEINLNAGEKYVVHPSNVIAYTVNSTPPSPYRLKSSSFRLQTPTININSLFSEIKFFRAMQETRTWQTIIKVLLSLRTWARKTIWGDRLFLQLYGPTRVLLQSRATRLSDALTSQEVNEIAKTPPGAVHAAMKQQEKGEKDRGFSQKKKLSAADQAPRISVASVGQDGKVKFEAVETPQASQKA